MADGPCASAESGETDESSLDLPALFPSVRPAAPAQLPWAPPAQLDEYRILRPLGRGAMGQVYLGHDTLLDRMVAIKFLSASDPDAAARERFLVEAKAIARLAHPNVVTIYRVGEVQGRQYLVSEFVRGRALGDLPRPVPWRRVLGIGIGLSRGLAAAHRRGVLHRDIKPANTILADDGEVKLLDFGLAKLLDAPSHPVRPEPGEAAEPMDATPSLTRTGALLGTPLYMAPEVWRGEPATRQTDIYSLGALLYELCAGRPPHTGRTLHAVGLAVQHGDAQPLGDAAPDVDTRLADVVDRCLCRTPAERFASGEELCHALERLSEEPRARVMGEGNPYRGLLPFEDEHRAQFFGRRPEIRAVLDLLRAESVVLVAGDSGVGKSSLCRAGVVPAVKEGALLDGRRWSVISLVPGRHPLSVLALALAGSLKASADDLLELLRQDPAALVRQIRQAQGDDCGLLLFIDQMEELLTQGGAADAAGAGELLGHLCARVPGIRVLLTARGDFLTRLATLPGLGAELVRVLYILRPLSADGLREAIAGPAQASGVRFEPDSLVDELVEATTRAEGGLPLLQFALGELWEVRDRERQIIPAAALSAIGGVAGALSRHADGVLGSLLPAQRRAARRILVKLVTLAETRARRTARDLLVDDADTDARLALESLVRGRLLVAEFADAGEGEEAIYQVAHEALLHGWGTLRGWLEEDPARRALAERLGGAAAEWQRLGGTADGLWNDRQMAEVASVSLDPSERSPLERDFLSASRRHVQHRRWGRLALLLGVPLALASVYGGSMLRARLQLDRAIAEHLGQGELLRARARAQDIEVEALRREAFRQFDQGDGDRGEEIWSRAAMLSDKVRAIFAQAGGEVETALLLDGRRSTVREAFAQVLYEQALLAERDHRGDEQADLLRRMERVDDTREFIRRWREPARLSVETSPPGARIMLQRYVDQGGRRMLSEPEDLGVTPREPGSYLLTVAAAGRAPVRHPVLLGRGEVLPLRIDLPPAAAVPKGFVYVPAGRFLYGRADEKSLRARLSGIQPLHEVSTGAFAISRAETTYGEWLDFLSDLPPAERARRRPHVRGVPQGVVDLGETGEGHWRLTLQPTSVAYSARVGEMVRYQERDRRGVQDWLRLPVSGISWEDAQAYLQWLRSTGRVPGARLCDEHEWERAARGADGRLFPHGDVMAPDDANIDETYGRRTPAYGPDEVGAHPSSDSPLGVADLAGNVWEFVRSTASPQQLLMRGGSYYHGQIDALSTNREPLEATARDLVLGLRVCASIDRR